MAYLNRAEQIKLPPLQFPNHLPGWTAIKAPNNVDMADAFERVYVSQKGPATLDIRRSRHSGVLHDLTSCLIAANTHPIVIGQVPIAGEGGAQTGELVRYFADGKNNLALMWFQSKSVTATDRWQWRWLSIADEKVRTAPLSYQAEITVEESGNDKTDIIRLAAFAATVFQQLETM